MPPPGMRFFAIAVRLRALRACPVFLVRHEVAELTQKGSEHCNRRREATRNDQAGCVWYDEHSRVDTPIVKEKGGFMQPPSPMLALP